MGTVAHQSDGAGGRCTGCQRCRQGRHWGWSWPDLRLAEWRHRTLQGSLPRDDEGAEAEQAAAAAAEAEEAAKQAAAAADSKAQGKAQRAKGTRGKKDSEAGAAWAAPVAEDVQWVGADATDMPAGAKKGKGRARRRKPDAAPKEGGAEAGKGKGRKRSMAQEANRT